MDRNSGLIRVHTTDSQKTFSLTAALPVPILLYLREFSSDDSLPLISSPLFRESVLGFPGFLRVGH